MEICIIGGGPAGMMAAKAVLDAGAQAVLIEKNEKLGKKLYITGKGRCNVTNARPMDEFMNYIPGNPRFLYSAFAALSNDELRDMIEEAGTALKVERGERVFPVSDRSSDILRALSAMIKDADIRLNTRVISLKPAGSKWHVQTSKGNVTCDAVILATGGLSYKQTGSDGEGHKIARELGHKVTPVYPSLVPMVCKERETCASLQGLSLKNVTLTLLEGKKKRFFEQGEMIFTHFGISGPIVLSASAHISKYDFSDTKVQIDLKPALSEEKLNARVLRDFEERKNMELRNALGALMPSRLCSVIIAAADIKAEKRVNEVTKAERARLVETLKAFTLHISGLRSIDEAIVTRGGVSIKEIDPATMQSKLLPGLYFAGELMDVDAYTGGFNLQIAFSTGMLAGKSAAAQ